MSVEDGSRLGTESSEPVNTSQAETSTSKRPPSIFDWGSPDPLIQSRGVAQTPPVDSGGIRDIFGLGPVGKTNEKKPTGPVNSQGTVVEFPGKKGPK
ncbi:MAG TPA: hypothetical protein VM077_00400 [Candidatus Limnocylindrales bacterium]|nr:hypothetical protein [Candidatus Limnocylindrales bacterium]